MRGVHATAPDGATWTVRRRWIPHRDGVGVRARLKRRTKRGLDALDIPDFGIDLEGIAIVIALVALLVIALVFGWPILLLGIDLAWLLLVGIFGTIGRVLLRRPWRVEATTDAERYEWFAPGFRAAGHLRDDLANQFRHGAKPHEAARSELPH